MSLASRLIIVSLAVATLESATINGLLPPSPVFDVWESSAMALLGAGLCGIGVLRRRRR
jgi:hypothetical protein